MIFRRRIKRLLPCVLEVILALKVNGVTPTPDVIASRLGVDVNSVVEALNLAYKSGLLIEGSYDLTDEGRSLILSHRERFLHDKIIHRFTSPWQSLRKIDNMQAHWTSSHGSVSYTHLTLPTTERV